MKQKQTLSKFNTSSVLFTLKKAHVLFCGTLLDEKSQKHFDAHSVQPQLELGKQPNKK